MEKFTNVKSIQFKVLYDVCGCVNFDGPETVNTLKSLGLFKPVGNQGYNNNKFAKRHFSPEDPKLFKYCISGECLKKAIFGDTMYLESPDRMRMPHVMPMIAAHPDLIIRGYVTASKVTKLQRASALCFPDAEELAPWRDTIVMDFHSRSGEKKLNAEKKDGDEKDTTIYKVENVGKGIYQNEGSIDIEKLQFISADPIFDRQAVEADGGIDESIFLNSLKENMINFTPEIKYWYRENNYLADIAAERGVLLNSESIDMLIRHTLKKIMNISITRSYSWAKFKSMTITVICDEMPDPFTIDHNNIDEFYFDPHIWYEEATAEQIEANHRLKLEMEAAEAKAKAEEKAKKAASKKNNQDNITGE